VNRKATKEFFDLIKDIIRGELGIQEYLEKFSGWMELDFR
jgi:hypothetical protein